MPFNYCTTHRIASSQAAGNWLFSKVPFNVVPIGIKVESFKFQLEWRQEYREKLKVEENEILIGHVGEFNKNKNQTFLIHLMSKLDENFKLILIGEGNLKDEYQQLVTQLKIEDRVNIKKPIQPKKPRKKWFGLF